MASVVQVAKAPKSAERKLVELEELLGRSGRTMRKRAQIASELIADREWVDLVGGEDKAYKILDDRYFTDCVGVDASAVVVIFREMGEDDWLAQGWNLKSIYAEYQRRHQDKTPEKGTRQVVTRKQHEEVVQENKEVTFALKRAQEQLQHATDEASSLRNRVRELELENASLKGRISELERLVRGQAA